MKKIALLYNHESSGDDFLPHTRYDSILLKKFLMSPLGGGWNDNEVVIFNNANTSDVKRNELLNVDYALIHFSGHGGSKDGETLLNFLDRNLPEREIRLKNCKKQLILIDACRSALPITESTKAAALSALTEGSPIIRVISRTMYELKIDAAEEGITVLHSCAMGQSSIDGIFINCVTDVCSDWSKGLSMKTLDIRNFTKIANSYLEERREVQRISLRPEKRNNHFPIACAI